MDVGGQKGKGRPMSDQEDKLEPVRRVVREACQRYARHEALIYAALVGSGHQDPDGEIAQYRALFQRELTTALVAKLCAPPAERTEETTLH
jgi:hypothetical protein